MPNNFSTFQQNVRVGPALDAHGVNRNTLRSTKIEYDKDSIGKAICFINNGSRSKDKKYGNVSRKLDINLPRLEGDIQDTRNVGESNLNLIELQRDLTTLTSKYEFLQHEVCHSREGQQKLEQEWILWILERVHMMEEFKLLKTSEVRIQRLHGDD